MWGLETPQRGNEKSAQGIALGKEGKGEPRPERAKELKNNAFALAGRTLAASLISQDDALG